MVAITIDCPDPPALAAFHQQATGLEPHPKSDADFAGLNGEHGPFTGFQRVDDYRAPSRPGQVVPQLGAAKPDDAEGTPGRIGAPLPPPARDRLLQAGACNC